MTQTTIEEERNHLHESLTQEKERAEQFQAELETERAKRVFGKVQTSLTSV